MSQGNGRTGGWLRSFRALQAEGLGVLDVGARAGITPALRSAAPLLDVVGLEPDAEEARRLSRQGNGASSFRSLRYLSVALGREDGQRSLNVCRSPGGSSFLQPNRPFLDRFPDAGRSDVVGTVSVAVRSLDSLRREQGGGLPAHIDFIKLDTQGSEADILDGAAETLKADVVAVEIEVLFAPLYERQPVFRDVDARLAAAGFTLFKLRRQELVRRAFAQQAHLSAGQLIFGDALYLRDPLGGPWAPRDARQLEALLLTASLYDLHDFALEILSHERLARLAAEQGQELRRTIERRSRRLGSLVEQLRVIRGRWLSADGMKRYAGRWARGDDNFYSPL